MTDDSRTLRWWTILRAIAAFNIVAWIGSCVVVADGLAGQRLVQAQLALSGIYVVVCAYRSFWPRIDLERTVLVDSFASSVGLGRSAATVAEVSFAVQVALIVREVGERAGVAWVESFAVAIVALLTLAQVFCWSSVITLSHLGHAIEESLWAATFAVVGVALGVSAPHLDGAWRLMALCGAVCCACFFAFMVSVDVPMYVRRWRQSLAAGAPRLGLADGIRDAFFRREPTRSWVVWRPEVAWLTGYFSFAVWLSLGMLHLSRSSP